MSAKRLIERIIEAEGRPQVSAKQDVKVLSNGKKIPGSVIRVNDIYDGLDVGWDEDGEYKFGTFKWVKSKKAFIKGNMSLEI